MIPRVIHAVWVGPPIPVHLRKNLDRWTTMHPTWTLMVWRDSDLAWLRHRDLYERAADIVPVDAIGQFQSDIARYEILLRHGGLYVDCDTWPMRDVSPALEGLSEFAAAEDHKWVGNTYLGSEPDHPLMAELIERIPSSIARFKGVRPNLITGPKYLTPIWRKHRGYVAPQRLWFPYSYADVKRGTIPAAIDRDVYAVHEWQHTRGLVRDGTV